MFDNLMAEVEYVKQARGYGILESIVFIQEYEEEYPSEVRRELKEFMRQGAKMFVGSPAKLAAARAME
jgi:hypothetical protein